MSLQMIQTNQGTRLYSQERDAAHNFGQVMATVIERMNRRPWATADEYLRSQGVTDEQVSDAITTIVSFVDTAKGDDVPLMKALKERGVLDINEHANMVIMAYIGSTMMGIYYQGVQEATRMGDDPTKRFPNLREAATTTANAMKKSPWSKLLRYAWQESFGRLWRKK